MAHHVTLRFYAELRDFLARDSESGTVVRNFDVPGSVKDLIEACGVPHPEVDLILANGTSVDYGYRVGDGDRISVYPPFHEVDISAVSLVRPDPLPVPRFVTDVNLGRLARFLRLLGLDTLCDPALDDAELGHLSTGQDRILLTRDVELLKHKTLTHGYFVRAIAPRAQVLEVANRFRIGPHLAPFTRCMMCNGSLEPRAKADVIERVPDGTGRHIEQYSYCSECDRIYWRGAQHPSLSRLVEAVRAGSPRTAAAQ